MDNEVQTVAVVGTGLVGCGWAIVFARAGLRVLAFDSNQEALARCKGVIAESLTKMRQCGLVDNVEDILGRISTAGSLELAIRAADYVQESVFEREDVKAAICREIEPFLTPQAVVGSSSSGIPASAFTARLSRRERFLVVHPVNPPHLIPLVELVPSPWTDREILPGLRRFMERVHQMPIVVNREIDGFIINRLQGALLNEAWALYEEGYATAEDIDRTVAYGLGLRWSFMGPFETIDLNAPGGIADYARRLGPLYHRIAESRRNPRPWSKELIAQINDELRTQRKLDDLTLRSEWRDKKLMSLAVDRMKEGTD